MEDLSKLITEQKNPKSARLDEMSSLEIVQLMNEEDHSVPKAITPILPNIAEVVERLTQTLRNSGRIFYIGAGTSGRLGVLDASECPPTFSTDPEWVQGIIAGSDHALRFAVEGAEDSPEAGAQDLKDRMLSSRDFVIGLAASGRTPYVIGAIQYAKQIGAGTAAITCNPGSKLGGLVEHPLEVNVGPEILVGSTRLKAGTAQKMILNMLSTATMVRLGKTYGNLMVDVKPTNEKLINRAQRIIQSITNTTAEEAQNALTTCDGEVKTAILMLLMDLSPQEARDRLNRADGRLKDAMKTSSI